MCRMASAELAEVADVIRMLALLAAVTTQPPQVQCVGSCWGHICFYRLVARCYTSTCADHPDDTCENVVQDVGTGIWDPRPAPDAWPTEAASSSDVVPVWPTVVVPPRPKHKTP